MQAQVHVRGSDYHGQPKPNDIYTPRPVAPFLFDLLSNLEITKVLDPAIGTGAITDLKFRHFHFMLANSMQRINSMKGKWIMMDPILTDSISDQARKMVDRCIVQAASRLAKAPTDLTLEEIIRNSMLIYSIIYGKRYFNADDNPRLKRQLPQGPIRLYHFTASAYIDSIRRNGLKKGDVPVRISETGMMPSDEDFNNAVWLTSDINAVNQQWSGGSRDYRLTLQIEADDPNLWRWLDLCEHLRMSPEARRILARGNKPYDWWVYVNQPITTTAITVYNKLPSSGRMAQIGIALDGVSLSRELVRRGIADEAALRALGWMQTE